MTLTICHLIYAFLRSSIKVYYPQKDWAWSLEESRRQLVKELLWWWPSPLYGFSPAPTYDSQSEAQLQIDLHVSICLSRHLTVSSVCFYPFNLRHLGYLDTTASPCYNDLVNSVPTRYRAKQDLAPKWALPVCFSALLVIQAHMFNMYCDLEKKKWSWLCSWNHKNKTLVLKE